MQAFNPTGLERLRKTPPFENPVWFDENGKNTYYSRRDVTSCNWVFMTEDDFLLANTDTSIAFTSRFELVFEDNKDNRYNRQYLELEDGRFADANVGFDFSFGDLFRGSKIANIYQYNEFLLFLRENNHSNIADKLEKDG